MESAQLQEELDKTKKALQKLRKAAFEVVSSNSGANVGALKQELASSMFS
jgi:hypothetical protein